MARIKTWAKRIGGGVGAVAAVLAAAASAYGYSKASSFDASVEEVHAIAPVELGRSSDAAVIARGKHLAESIAPCATSHCHGADLAGGETSQIGPIGTFTAPNITPAGVAAAYSDAELARLLRHGVKKDGRSVVFMPVDSFSWLPDSDLIALVSYVRSIPPVERANGPNKVGLLGKVLDRRGQFPLVMADRIDHDAAGRSPAPTPTAEYGAYVGRLCQGCHGPTLTGGPIPGAPPGMPVPKNLTPDATGLGSWQFADFERTLSEGVSKDGRKLDPMMPWQTFGKMDDVEKRALWAFLQSQPPRPFGGR